MSKLLYLLLLIPFCGKAQENVEVKDTTEGGIYFEEAKDWREIQAKAMAESKYIFVDCFATWCAPCKLMDREVYSEKSVGAFMNTSFISIRVQMDTTVRDGKNIRKWYEDAHAIKENFKIETFPTYLFFSPDGVVVHIFSGAIRDTDFLNVAKNALNPGSQYYTLTGNYQKGLKNYQKMPYMANTAKAIGDVDLANRIAGDYIQNYLVKQDETELYSKKNIEFVSASPFWKIVTPKDRIFMFFCNHSDRIDSIMSWKGFAEGMVRDIITKEEIDPRLWPDEHPINTDPDWGKLSYLLKKRYGKMYAEHVIIDAKIRWYDYKKDWPEITKYTVVKIDKYGLDTAGLAKYMTNNVLYEVIFQHSENKEEINKAIEWMKIILGAIQDYADGMDTYANLLYKVGRVKEALTWEEKAARLKPENTEIQNSFEKMKKRLPTW